MDKLHSDKDKDIRVLPRDRAFFDMFRSHKNFGLKVRQEIKRAERYCEFISLVVITFKGLNYLKFPIGDEYGNYNSLDDFYEALRKLICKTVRDTDYVSGTENNKMGLLLVETSKDGAEKLINRLKTIISNFIAPYFNPTDKTDWGISYLIFSIPSDQTNKEEMLNIVKGFLEG